MTLDELQAARKDLEGDIRTYLASRIKDFASTTGVSVASINVETINGTSIGDQRKHYLLGEVTVEVEI